MDANCEERLNIEFCQFPIYTLNQLVPMPASLCVKVGKSSFHDSHFTELSRKQPVNWRKHRISRLVNFARVWQPHCGLSFMDYHL